MNEYVWADLRERPSHEFTVELTRDMMDLSQEISGDTNPLHSDTDFAPSVGCQKIIVASGLLTSAFYSTLVGVHLPGRNKLFHGLAVDLVKLAFPGDRLTF